VMTSTHLVLTKIIEENLHRPVSLEVLAAVFGQTSPSKIRPTIARNLTLEILDLANSIRRIFRRSKKNRGY